MTNKQKCSDGYEVPVIEPKEVSPPAGPNPVMMICGLCGVEWRRVMHYACSQTNCPIQSKITNMLSPTDDS